ncbi:Gamma-glutamyltranspeptidase precursor [Aquisphaera giovannonii]|uniref:Glutathione hydrolase proenzyme n=1 Tax=Aquisphaera giovannonii TaxID=406548 RepID=A0A5B9WBU5_9BACT|nr:gamma-glutamyltransferase [Aquisphaera giovannonii]QEH38148.1 Gamma-glutamyltranspeptidase precursor [Aquisphaera giovannonii]
MMRPRWTRLAACAAVMGLTMGEAGASDEVFSRQAVASQEEHASEAGAEALRRGGNAVDAAIATAFALAVTLPEAGNLGGGGFLVAYLADRREVVTVDFREEAPASSTPGMYLDAAGKLLPKHRLGARAAGVPGTVRGLALAHSKWGRLAWADLVRPAARLAREGFPISAELAGALNAQLAPRKPGAEPARGPYGRLADIPSSVAAFARPDGKAWQGGDRLVQPYLAATLERIAEHGPDEFYKGKTAGLIVAYMEANGGEIRARDLEAYEAKIRPPVHTTYRGKDVYGMGPPSSGGVVLCQMLNILERYDLKADGRESPATVHRVTEAQRRAFYTRATRLADPDFVAIPVAELTSKRAADDLARTIGDRATPSASLAPFPILPAEPEHTTHLSTLDAAGNAAALTYTLEESYGSKAVVAGAGFLLNNEMGDFNLIPGRTDAAGRIGTEPNRIAPGKRMLSSMSPTLVLEGGKVRVVTGSPGGRTIPNTTLWVVLNLLEFGMPPREAVAAGRSHHQWFPDVILFEAGKWPQATLDGLAARGHSRLPTRAIGTANTIVVGEGPGPIHGVADLRRTTSAARGD